MICVCIEDEDSSTIQFFSKYLAAYKYLFIALIRI